MSRKAAEQRGRRAEAWAAFYLRLLGWRILARRLKTPRGEIDLIARRGRTIAFVEVKWRKEQRDLDLAIDGYRLRRVAEAAEAVAHRFSKQADRARIDVLLLAPWRLPRHITHAWQP
ncbi:YraN family protein [Tsuneonella sp. CC-YZS046]|uniref:YraN family protein n=1 Tax=Tsuneonella sp. CC-YZS046 TaxID=3042152 RepID=UPI002D790C7E|nr:YraN family protein [Tsuneonella sp. CC-YZS046]WRO67703.1 YraN family protein [Tsuneonella sp. CC-YZS046]